MKAGKGCGTLLCAAAFFVILPACYVAVMREGNFGKKERALDGASPLDKQIYIV